MRECSHKKHTKSDDCPYDKKSVPEHYFRKYPEHNDSPLFKQCLSCRQRETKRRKKNRDNLKKKEVPADKFLCHPCSKIQDKKTSQFGKNKCISCHEKDIVRQVHLKITYNIIKFEVIENLGHCCEECECVFLMPIENKVRCFEPFINEGVRYIKYEDSSYKTKEFLKKFKKEICIYILEFDHLNEEEQRKRGLLNSDEQFKKKKGDVCLMRCEDSMRLESKKCQLVCSACHIKISMKREKKDSFYTKLALKKKNYVESIKVKGCSTCNYINPNLLRFFEMDHIDPKTKIKGIAKIIFLKEFSLDDVINECKKCRVLCRFCHTLHTLKQLRYFEKIDFLTNN